MTGEVRSKFGPNQTAFKAFRTLSLQQVTEKYWQSMLHPLSSARSMFAVIQIPFLGTTSTFALSNTAHAQVQVQSPPGLTEIRSLAERLNSTDEITRYRALEQIRTLGNNGESAIPAMLSALRVPDSSFTQSVAMALVAIGPNAIPSVLESTNDPNEMVRAKAYFVLLRLRRVAPDHIKTHAIAALEDPSPIVRADAIFALYPTYDFPGSIDKITEMMKLPRQGAAVYRQLALAYQNFGPKASSATLPLLRIARNPKNDPEWRSNAVVALASIAPRKESITDLFFSIASDEGEDVSVRIASLSQLAEFADKKAISIAIKVISNPSPNFDEGLRQAAIQAIPMLPNAELARPSLLNLLKCKQTSIWIRSISYGAIGRMSKSTRPSINDMIDLLANSPHDDSFLIARTLRNIASREDAVTALIVLEATSPTEIGRNRAAETHTYLLKLPHD